jgi:hypothetical protein
MGVPVLRLSSAVAFLAVSATLTFAASAPATPVATSDPQYQAYGAVFPDPLAVCQQNCDPNSRGRTNATQFIQYQEFVRALEYMNQKADWKRYMEVLPLDGQIGDGAGTKAGDSMWPGNNLSKLEWDPKPQYQSAGLATTNQEQGTGKLKSDLIVVRVTDENVPDADKKRYALSLSIHGIERAGAEGGIRAMEEIVTAVSEERGDEPVLPKEVRAGAPTFRQVLANTIIYFTLPNPDGWRRGSLTDGGVFFHRYNGNGVDPNRDWPDIGYSFRGYSGDSEPETRAFKNFFREVEANGGQFAAGDDLHGQPFADALSYTLLPHGRHDINKDYRLREASKLINRAQYHATKWSPMIIDNDEQAAHCESENPLGTTCDRIYAQTWGSVYDTINYTTTGTLGDWFDSSIGLGADGIDNEMSFSHLDRNIAFEPHGEQLHVAGNKAIIFSHVSDMVRPPGTAYSVPGRNAYVANQRLVREERETLPGAPAGTSPQADISDEPPPPDGFDPESGQSFFPFTVDRDSKTFNGGMRIDVRTSNVQGTSNGLATLQVQCKGCDEHIRPEGAGEDDWVTVAEDYNQDFRYAQAGLTAAVNRPDAYTGEIDNKNNAVHVEWRAAVSAPGGIPRFSIDFTSGPATSDGASGGDPPPRLAGYDVANTDFFGDLNEHASADDDEFDMLQASKIIDGTHSLDGVRTLVLADDPLPGYTGAYKGQTPPVGAPSPNSTFAPDGPRAPGQANSCVESEATTWTHEFTIAPNAANASMKVAITWGRETSDYDLHLYRTEYGDRTLVGESVDFNVETGPSETVTVPNPPAGKYEIVIVNCTGTPDDPWTGTIEFTARAAPVEGGSGSASAFSPEQKDAYMAKLKSWVEAGGNLVLTDGALRALPELTSIPGIAVRSQTVYVGQTAFQKCEAFDADTGACETPKETLDDPLAKDVAQPAARFNTGMRRQLFESTPLGFAIQDEEGTDASFARQFDVDQQAFQAAGGRVAGASVDGGARDAGPVLERTALGEIKLGQGTIRIVGALLPQPSNQYDHPLGVEPYSVTYTGYIVFCNLVDCKYEAKKRPALPNPPAPPGPVQLPFDARVQSPLLASNTAVRGRNIRLRIRKTGVRRISHLVLQYRRTGRGTSRKYRTLRPKLSPNTKRIQFTKGRIGQTYLFRIHAVGKSGVRSAFRYSRTVYPYDDRGKGRRYSAGWTRVKNKLAWLGGYSQSSRPGATLRFDTRGGGRVYLVGRTGPNGGKAVFGRGTKKKVVSFKSKKRRNRVVVGVIDRTDKRARRFRLRVLSGTVTVDGIGVRRR